MKLNIEVLQRSLLILSKGEDSLETALNEAQREAGIQMRESHIQIRDFLVEKKLLIHNPKLRYQVSESSGPFTFTREEIHKDFVLDSITKECLTLIEEQQLVSYLLEIMDSESN